MVINSHSVYSLRFGILEVKELLTLLKEMGIECFALTDVNNTSACMDFLRLAPDYGIKPVVGIDFRNGIKQQFIGVARTNTGFKELNTYLSEHLHADQAFTNQAFLSEHTFCIIPFENYNGRALAKNEFIGLRPEQLTRVVFLPKSVQKKMVALLSFSFRNKTDYNTHRLLRAIDNNALLTNTGVEDLSYYGSDVQTLKEHLQLFQRDFPEALQRTSRLLSVCHVNFDFSGTLNLNQQLYTNSSKLDFRFLRKLTYDGVNERYGKLTPVIQARIEKELGVILEKGFTAYFLLNWKIVKFARHKGFFYVGRGSGANSVVAYLIGITDVDPIELDLYFERFINLYRQNPPDFDIDFSWVNREEITSFIFSQFKNVSLLGSYVTFQYKGVVRELGKVFGMPKMEIDKLSEEGRATDELSGYVLRYGHRIQNKPNYLGIHAAGILISEEVIQTYCGTFMPPKGFQTTQFDMVVAEDLGLHKFDILSQRGLSKIQDTIELVKHSRGKDESQRIKDIAKVKNDKEVLKLLAKGEAIGCFYIESPAMRNLMKKLEVRDYLGLVAASSVIRPGVARSGMMRTFIERYRFPEKREEAHPILQDILKETYGVMVYQEDVIKVAHYFGGLTLAEADMLRRGMSGKYRSREEFMQVKDSFFNNCKERGESETLVQEIWFQIESFAGYAFAKGHSASYAVESFQSLYLKAYYPLEYMVATINNFGGFYRTEFYVQEARKLGGKIHAPCVNKGYYGSMLYGRDIYLGFNLVSSLNSAFIKRFIGERLDRGEYDSLEDFVDRNTVSLDSLVLLIRSGAFRFTAKSKAELLWLAHLYCRKDRTVQEKLFKAERQQYIMPNFPSDELQDAWDEFELLGFFLKSPFKLIEQKVKLRPLKLLDYVQKKVRLFAYLVTVKRTKTVKNEQMFFGTFLTPEGEWLDTVHFPSNETYKALKGRGVYDITGKVIEEFGVCSLEVEHLEKLSYRNAG